MTFYSFLTDRFKKNTQIRKTNNNDTRQVLNVKQMMEELGVRTSATIGSYEDEERILAIFTYLNNEGARPTLRLSPLSKSAAC